MKAMCRAVRPWSIPTTPLLIHLRLVLPFPLLSLPFVVSPASKDPLRVELGHLTRHLTIGEVCTSQMHMREPTGGNIVQELLVALGDALGAPSELR